MIDEVIIIGTGKVAYHFAKEINNNPKLKLIQILGRSKSINSHFNEFSDIKQEIGSINNTMRMATFGVFGFLGALAIAVVTSMMV